MLEFFLTLLGLIGLWLGTELVIRGAVNIANYYELSQVFVGVAVLAVGTDLPEMVIAINASIQNVLQGVNTSGIIIGNAIGSSFSQISLVLGIAGLLGYLTLSKRHLYEDGIVLLGAVLLLILLGFDGQITRIEGIVLIVVYAMYYSRLIHQERLGQKIKKKYDKGISMDILYLILGMAIVIFASEIVVDNSVKFSEKLGIRQSFVGIIIIGLGTSLPELALSLNAVRKKAIGLSVGNLIGSNIFDLLIPVGTGAIISELKFERSLIWFDFPFLFLLSFIVLFFFKKKKGLQKIEAVILIGIFALYAALKVVGV
ncbi:calcium/sodium antiporter [uncultured Eudoraea sp.]|uniref:calcium/sodium antiporter n=1 Tax=uncultured Eudoraea sp. TaxID=1035614 RepID=UPI00261F2C10|nr:calcium/sodium antiporter [uncultured Eudoraea sp.]